MASNVKERLLEYLRHRRMTQMEFTKSIGVSPTYIGAMRKSLSTDKVMKIRQLYPDLNTSWLLYGEGEMLVTPGAETSASGEGIPEGYEVPLLPVAAFAGNLQSWSEGYELSQCEKIIAPVKGVDFAIRLSGDSMEPVLHNGSTLFIKRINEKAFLPWGNMMVVDTENGVLVKAVYPVPEEPNMIEARSVNPKYPPIRIPGESIFGIYRILSATTAYATM
ncbi:MAG: hypothetical protein K2M56_02060 [Muribaculaceae bacterium]|nr:hypothetical protein [Muribaculaceae bacterium]